ncbi:THAP domain-containing protein 6-like [Episyrphus balteatus]|uniref:THAP domain-containing protein 6-like n=1 Tax=Episyrphus balteatus TaxID=286459 RepID=UPI0024860460|nr:THAP domain-containing protein 6-like [Episyrphus balteatus]
MGFCIVRGCKSRSDSNNRGTKFHVMPRIAEIREKWIAAIGRSTIPKSGSVCSKHFLPEDYQMSRSGCSESLLKTAIPSLNLIPTFDIEDGNEDQFFEDDAHDNDDAGLDDYVSTI